MGKARGPGGTQGPRELSRQDAQQGTKDRDEQNPKSHLGNRWESGTRLLFPNQVQNRKAVQRCEGQGGKAVTRELASWRTHRKLVWAEWRIRERELLYTCPLCLAGPRRKSQRMAPFSTPEGSSPSVTLFVVSEPKYKKVFLRVSFHGDWVSAGIAPGVIASLYVGFFPPFISFFTRLNLA